MYKFFLIFFSMTLFSQQYESQDYNVLESIGDVEIRYYPPVMKAKVTSDKNFSKLFRFISGNNHKEEKIAMTTPVYMTRENGSETMEFVMPSKYNQENIVNPNDKSITVYSSKPGYYAAIRYGGYSNYDKVKKHHKILLENLENNNIKVISTIPASLSYNSPYKVFNRRNEVLVKIDYTN
mgnify:FL=1